MKLILIILLNINSAYAIELFLNGVRYLLQGYEISNNGQTISINHDAVKNYRPKYQNKSSSTYLKKPTYQRKPAAVIRKKPKKGAFGRLIDELNAIQSDGKHKKRNYQ